MRTERRDRNREPRCGDGARVRGIVRMSGLLLMTTPPRATRDQESILTAVLVRPKVQLLTVHRCNSHISSGCRPARESLCNSRMEH